MDYDRNILMETYKMGRLLGQGTFAKVYYARNVKTGQGVAIKVIDKDKVIRSGIGEHVKREISVMRRVKHPNIVELYEVLATRRKIYFVMEYVKGGDLFERLEKGGKLGEDDARRVFQQLVSAVEFCHGRGVFHRDLKLENLLLDENGDLKITDFGLSALVDGRRKDELLHTTCGTPAYVAPEVINRSAYYGDAADVWSCGVVLFALLAGFFPFHDSNMMELYRKIGIGSYKCPKCVPSEAKRLIARILDPEPSSRITIELIKQDSWFTKGRDESRPEDVVGTEKEVPEDVAAVFGSSSGASEEVLKIEKFMAFDIIASFSSGLDLSGLFDDEKGRKEARFTSKSSAKTIISRFESLEASLKMRVVKKHDGVLKLEGGRGGRKGVVGIDAEIFEIASGFHLVEIKKSSGDTFEYRKVLKEEIRPALEDIVWAWQDDGMIDGLM